MCSLTSFLPPSTKLWTLEASLQSHHGPLSQGPWQGEGTALMVMILGIMSSVWHMVRLGPQKESCHQPGDPVQGTSVSLSFIIWTMGLAACCRHLGSMPPLCTEGHPSNCQHLHLCVQDTENAEWLPGPALLLFQGREIPNPNLVFLSTYEFALVSSCLGLFSSYSYWKWNSRLPPQFAKFREQQISAFNLSHHCAKKTFVFFMSQCIFCCCFLCVCLFNFVLLLLCVTQLGVYWTSKHGIHYEGLF